MSESKKKLRIVEPRHELSGKFPRRFEQAVRRAQSGDPLHRGVLFTGVTVARRAAHSCLAPSAAARALGSLEVVVAWAKQGAALGEVKRSRAALFDAARELEQTTLSAMDKAGVAPEHGFDEHVQGVIRRYVGLSVHHAVSAALHCHDAVLDPLALLEVSKETAAALAYRNVGLGPARSAELRELAARNARWEASNVAASALHSEQQLMVQLLHEYLGVHWKNHADAQRLYLEQFLSWAVPPALG